MIRGIHVFDKLCGIYVTDIVRNECRGYYRGPLFPYGVNFGCLSAIETLDNIVLYLTYITE